jgi:glucokinase
MAGQAAGVDLGGTKVQGVIVDKAGNQLATAVASTPVRGGPASVVEQVAAVVRAAAANAGIGVDELDGVGVGSAGTVSPGAGLVLHAGNLSGFERPVPLARLVAGALALDPAAVGIENDVNVAALAEYRIGAGQGLDSLLAVFAGTGVGGAVVLGGRLRHGARGAAGEIGHTVVVMMEGEPCPCGRRGCVEAYAGRTPMERAVRAAVAAGRATELPAIQERLGRSRLDAVVLAEALALGDELAAELVALAARALGTAIGSACNLLDVQGVLLGGGLADGLGEPFARQVEGAVTPLLLANEPPVEVRRTALGGMAGAIGAGLLVHEPPSPS